MKLIKSLLMHLFYIKIALHPRFKYQWDIEHWGWTPVQTSSTLCLNFIMFPTFNDMTTCSCKYSQELLPITNEDLLKSSDMKKILRKNKLSVDFLYPLQALASHCVFCGSTGFKASKDSILRKRGYDYLHFGSFVARIVYWYRYLLSFVIPYKMYALDKNYAAFEYERFTLPRQEHFNEATEGFIRQMCRYIHFKSEEIVERRYHG
jgi:hypothetical protein